ncbi:alpha/beta fold hydrolase [Chloroflexota bacterium]
MPTATIDNTLEMYYELDDFTDPWREADTVVLHHGFAKNSRLWYSWPPLLARKYRVVRLDARGFGKSTVPPPGYLWSLSGFAHDLRRLLDHLGVEKVHLVGESLGGAISLQFAYEYPGQLHSLTVCGAPYNFTTDAETTRRKSQIIMKEGTIAYAMDGSMRRFNDKPEYKELAQWFANEMSKPSRRVMLEVFEYVPTIDLTEILPSIQVPTLIMGGEESIIMPPENCRKLQQLLPNAKLVLFPGAPNHICAAIPQQCVEELLKFLGEINDV